MINRSSCTYVILLVEILLFLPSCNPQYYSAKILMEGQEYEAAESVYQDILRETPGDAEALVGLRRARLGWIDRKLLDVRRLRLSDQAETSFGLLKEIQKREHDWQFIPDGAVHFTQIEEIEYAAKYVEAKVEILKDKGYFLKAREFVETSSSVFQSPRSLVLVEKWKRSLRESARQECRGYEESLEEQHSYSAIFMMRYCATWGHSVHFKFDPARIRTASLYRDLLVSGSPNTIPQELLRYGLEKMVRDFRETPWFDANGQVPLETKVVAVFDASQQKEVENALHTYTVDVPYLQTEMIAVPQFGFQQVCDANGYCRNAPQSSLSFQPVTVTKYRHESRKVPFKRWRHHQTLFFQGEIISMLGDMTVSAIHTEKFSAEDTEHPHALPEVGLEPDPLELKDPLLWLMTQIDKAVEKWRWELGNSWERINCEKPEEARNENDLSNYVLRCLHGLPKDARVPLFVDTFFQDKFGASHQTVEGWMALKW